MRVDNSNPNTVYHTFNFGDLSPFGTGFLERSDNAGVNWAGKVSGINLTDGHNFYVPYVMDPSNSSRLLLGTDRVYETTNRAESWSPISMPNTNGWVGADAIDSLATSALSASTIYASAGGRIFVTTNRGATWQQGVVGRNDNFSDLLVDPTNSQIAYAVSDQFGGSHVWRTTNGGANWEPLIGRNLPDLPTLTIELDPKGPGPADDVLFVGTDVGVYASTDLGGSWSRYGTGLPNVRVNDLEFNANLGILAAGTYGRGMWVIGTNLAPTNDNLANAFALTGGSATATGSNLNATAEPGEPVHAGKSGGNPVWWDWTAPSSGTATVSTTGSDFDTLLAVYTGSSVSALTEVARNDNAGGTPQSQLSFSAVAGTVYHIAADGASGVTGSVSLAISQSATAPPPNDNFANAIALSGTSAMANGTNATANKETAEPNHAGNSGGKSVWWTWTAPATGDVTLSTAGSGFDTLLAVYAGSSVASLTSVVSNNDFGGGPHSQVTFSAVAGTTYRIAVDGAGGTSGNISLALTQTVTAPPTNNNFANAVVLTGDMPMTTGSNAGATKETGEPNHAGVAGGRSVWWRWTAPGTGNVVVRTFDSKFDTLLAVYTGASVAALTPVNSNDNFGGALQSQAYFAAVAGTTYHIAVDGVAGASGNITLSLLSALATAPANNSFVNRIPLSGTSLTTSGSNLGATTQPGEPSHAGGATAWWTWTPSASGTVTISTAGSSFDTVLSVYTGTSVSALTLVAQNDNDNVRRLSSGVTFDAVAGTAYQIAVDGALGATGSVALSLTESLASAPANDLFANALTLSGLAPTTTGTNTGATKEVGEANHADNAGGKSVWWTWTAPLNGDVTVSTAGSSFDTLLAVSQGNAVVGQVPVASNDDFNISPLSQVTFAALAGATYHIAVDGKLGASGNIALALTETPTAPPNDSFANSAILNGVSTTANGANIAATKESSEPDHADNPGGASVWTSWTAPASGSVTLSTAGSNFDTLLAVYTGLAVSALTTVASNNDFGGTPQSQVTFDATTGTTYRIAVDGIGGAAGNVTLTLTETLAAPANDAFANSILLNGSSANTTGTNVGATEQAGEPDHAGNTGGKSVWWTWIAPASGTVTISSLGSSFDTLLAVYGGPDVASLTPAASNDDFGGTLQSQVTFVATAGVTYRIAVDGSNGDSGNIALVLSSTTGGPANDNFANNFLLAGSSVTTSAFNVNATKEPSEPNHAGNSGGKSVWWSWIAPATGQAVISTAGSAFDTLLAVYTGSSVSSLTPVSSNDDFAGATHSQVSFAAVAGTLYWIAVDGFGGASGAISLVLNLAAAAALAPSNDNFSNAATLSGSATTATGSNVAATSENGEPSHAGNPAERPVWWQWTAPLTGNAIISTSGSSFDTVLAVYTGTSLSGAELNPVASNDDVAGTPQSRVIFPITAGTTYRIAVDGFGGASGAISLALNFATMLSSVTGRRIFYNNSFFDGNSAAANANDDNAIALDKTALLPGGVATFANYTSYNRGINGVIVDIQHLADPGAVSASNFSFRKGNSNDLASWVAAPAPSIVQVRAGAGVDGAERVTLIWPDGTLKGTAPNWAFWLEITVQADAVTGLAAPDVFYFGNSPGESGNSQGPVPPGNTFVDATDFAGARDNGRNFQNRAPVDFPYDYSRDSFVDATDIAVARDHNTNFVTALKLLNLTPASGAATSAAAFVFQPERLTEEPLASSVNATTPARLALTVSPPLAPPPAPTMVVPVLQRFDDRKPVCSSTQLPEPTLTGHSSDRDQDEVDAVMEVGLTHAIDEVFTTNYLSF